MKGQKYSCIRCGEVFEIIESSRTQALACPRCLSEEIKEFLACSLEINSPPWEYRCQQCRALFSVTAPRGPDEAGSIRCPVCRSKNVKWLTLAFEACATGG